MLEQVAFMPDPTVDRHGMTEAVYRYVAAFLARGEQPPTTRAMGRALYLSQSSVRFHLDKLIRQGRLVPVARGARYVAYALPGRDQWPWEPPRVIPPGTPDRAARLKALGNSMVLPVVYAILANVQAWLIERDAEAAP
jgi:hypothetical protein